MDLVRILFPATCPVCEKVLPYKAGLICPECNRKLPYIMGSTCMKCGKPVDSPEVEYCFDCDRTKHLYDQGAAVFSYSAEIRDSIYRFKYSNKREYAKFYGEEMARCCERILARWRPDVIVPVPLHAAKLVARGYNQSEILARELGKRIHVPVDSHILERAKKTRPQKELNDHERKKNVENAFKIQKNIVKLKKVIIVDDIYTTGSTVDACAFVLKQHGAERVYSISLSIGTGF